MRPLLRLALVTVAAVALAACGSSGSPASSAGGGGPSAATAACQPTSQTGGVAVQIDNFAFNPGTIQAAVGQPITWTNAESISHGAVLDDDSTCSTGSFGKGGSGSLVFSKPGTYAYHCTVHGKSMAGTITITG